MEKNGGKQSQPSGKQQPLPPTQDAPLTQPTKVEQPPPKPTPNQQQQQQPTTKPQQPEQPTTTQQQQNQQSDQQPPPLVPATPENVDVEGGIYSLPASCSNEEALNDNEILELSNSVSDERDTSPWYYGWHVILAGSAFLDCMSVLIPMWLLTTEETVVEKKFFFGLVKKLETVVIHHEPETPWLNAITHWLVRNTVKCGTIYFGLWFVDAFIEAGRVRRKQARKLERNRLLHSQSQRGAEAFREPPWWDGPWAQYSIAVAINFLLLPVGFYVLIYHRLRASLLNRTAESSIVLADDFVISHQDFVIRGSLSLIFAIVRYSHYLSVKIFGDKVRRTATHLIKKVLVSAIRNPLKFQKRMRTALSCVRWAKYLAPLIGTTNKLLGNSLKLKKRIRQRYEAIIARRIRMILVKTMTPEERRQHSATVIQSAYRAYRMKKTIKAVRLIQGHKQTFYIIKVQTVLRGMAARARARLRQKKEELEKLQRQDKLAHQQQQQQQKPRFPMQPQPQQQQKQQQQQQQNADEEQNVVMTDADRRRMYQLQDELEKEARHLINKKLLLRPNTAFSMYWRMIFVFCVIFEISQLAFDPILAKRAQKVRGAPASVEEILERKLVPDPISTWDACIVNKQPKGGITHNVFNTYRNDSNNTDDVCLDDSLPWYCTSKAINTLQALYIYVVKFLIEEFLVLVAIICFLDVPITFFTGELDPNNGLLVPKPFFTRYILPGLLLQCIVNPQMESTATFFYNFLVRSADVGPIRVWRWMATLFYPLFLILQAFWMRFLWQPFVKRENRKVIVHQ